MIIFDKIPKSTMYQTPDKLMENAWYAWQARPGGGQGARPPLEIEKQKKSH